MVQLKIDRDDFDKIKALLPDICPEVSFSLQTEDDNLVKLGFCDSAPCVVEFDMRAREFYEMLDTLNDIEVDAFNVPDSSESLRNTCAYQQYLKYGCLYDILCEAERVYDTIGCVRYIGKSFGVDSLNDGRTYSVVDIEDGFIRVIDDSGEDYLYSITDPGSLVNPDLRGKWEIVDDPSNILKDYIE